jgi:heme iron utilization protein
MPSPPAPVAPADEAARAQARAFLVQSRHAALAYTDAETGTPGISRIAFGLAPDGTTITLVSSLAPHTASLRACPPAALMLGEPAAKGDPLTHPRLMIQVEARVVDGPASSHGDLRNCWLADHPKSKLYIDFRDFAFVRFLPVSARLNGGFGKAHRLSPEDLRNP